MEEPLGQEIYSVSRLNQDVKNLLEQAFPLIWVEGEISNLARPQSGHFYFTLKDSAAQVRCALFRNRASRLRFSPENGAQVRLHARLGLYAPRGEYQLIAEHMEPAGDGALQRAFEALKARLSAEGLFDPALKKSLPDLPQRIGVVTSATGAAIRDILSVLKRRFPALPVLIYPVRVQGEGAADDIASAIARADQRAEVDVLIVTRGGGSLEDLQAFNDEQVARAVVACSQPVISAVGHEVDVSICDFVADQRAATPSAAAELISPDAQSIQQVLIAQRSRLGQSLQRQWNERRNQITRLSERLSAQHPGRRLHDRAQRLDELERRLSHASNARLRHQSIRVDGLFRALQASNPARNIEQHKIHNATLAQRLASAVVERLTHHRARVQENARALEAVSPLATVHRGYAIVRRLTDGRILSDAQNTARGELLKTQLGHGELITRVESIESLEPMDPSNSST
ncbi:MAG: exodeoxyribonuclease VII large subunit [Spiribacter sp.]|nr:exodeoxyribonuclease VII large subunit [Spiribacter sp.]